MKKAYIILVTIFLYVILQFSWWAYLIYNQTISLGDSTTKAFWMVFGEGVIFLGFLILGFVLILRYLHSIKRQQKTQEDFLLSFTHELKTPITSTRLALQTLAKPLPVEKREEIIQNGVIQTQRLSSLVDNVLNASRASSKRYDLYPEQINLIDELKGCVLHLKSIYPNKINVTNSEKTQIQTDRYALGLILMNLLENACRYSDDKSSEVKVRIEKEGKKVRVQIENITLSTYFKDHSNEVFKKFKGQKGSSNHQSTGLGLYIVKEFTSILQGTIHFRNTNQSIIMELLLPIQLNK